MIIEWKGYLDTGHQEIDEQHKELYQRFNSLQSACNQGRGRKELYNLLIFLGEYVSSHFAAEERLQVRYGYPGYEAHKQEHDSFMHTFRELEQRLYHHGATPTLVIQTNLTMINWLIRHVDEMDKALAEHLKTVCPENEAPVPAPNPYEV